MPNARTNVAATTAAVTNRIATIQNMKVGALNITNASAVWAGGFVLTMTHATVAAGTDTLGTVAVVGTDMAGDTQTETLTPVADTLVTSGKIWRSITSLTGAGWAIAGGNDTLIFGVAAGCYCATGSGTLAAVVVNTTAAASVTVSDAAGTIATLKSGIAEGTYLYADIAWSGFLKVATTSTNDVTVVHTGTMPTSYSM